MKALTHKGLGKLAAGGMLAAALGFSVPTLADTDNERGRSSFDSFRPGSLLQVSERNRYDSRLRARPADPVTIRLNFDANGDGRIRLKRMLRDQHGIDPNEWRIRSVNVRHKSRRDACADLTVGGRSTGPVNLRKGITTIVAPRGAGDGAWVLGFENAKVRDVAVVLEPLRGSRHRRAGVTGRVDSHRELSFNARAR